MGGEAQGAVAAQGDHGADAERVENGQYMAGAVAFLLGPRVAARGMEDGAAGPVDAAHALAGERRG